MFVFLFLGKRSNPPRLESTNLRFRLLIYAQMFRLRRETARPIPLSQTKSLPKPRAMGRPR
jgi:hypothetical protein